MVRRLEAGCAAPFLHIRSAILKISQPRTVKPTPQKSMTDTIAFPFCFLQDAYALSRSTSSNKLLKQNRRGRPDQRPSLSAIGDPTPLRRPQAAPGRPPGNEQIVLGDVDPNRAPKPPPPHLWCLARPCRGAIAVARARCFLPWRAMRARVVRQGSRAAPRHPPGRGVHSL
jgi:hypothetical protein